MSVLDQLRTARSSPDSRSDHRGASTPGLGQPASALDGSGPRRPGIGSRSRRGAWVRLAVALVSLATLVASGIAWSTYRGFTASVGHGAPVPAQTGGDPDGADQNILLIGSDSRAGATPAELRALGTTDDGGSVNTDTMMILHIPAKGGRASVVSIPRDSWVSIPGFGKNKINAAYGDGYSAARQTSPDEIAAESAGIVSLIKTLNELTGLRIDHYVQVNLLGFYRISTAIGGVDVCLNAAQNAQTDSDAYGSGYSGINLPAGHSLIEGTQALAFVRQRHGLPQGDLDRIKRQQYFLTAAFHKIVSAGVLLNPFKLNRLLSAVSSSLLTDPGLNILSLAAQFRDMSAGNLHFETIPNTGSQTIYPDGVQTSIVAVDTAAIPGFINTLQGKPADPTLATAPVAESSTVHLDVLNGTSTAGLAARNSTALGQLGFHVETVDSADTTQQTTVEYPSGQQSQAKAVAAAAPGSVLVETASVQKVTLVLGSNGVEVHGAEPGGSTPSATPSTTSTSPSAPDGASASAAAAPKSAAASGLGCIN